MALLTVEAAVAASRRRRPRTSAVRELREAAFAPSDTTYDIFLSHSFEDAEVISGVWDLIEGEGLTVYVDWIEDPQADRSQVTPDTADMLRDRMNHCRALLYASSESSRGSLWMPWELGYFDGRKPNHVAIVPLLRPDRSAFQGLEYLGIYPWVELVDFIGGRKLASFGVGLFEAVPLREAVRRPSGFR